VWGSNTCVYTAACEPAFGRSRWFAWEVWWLFGACLDSKGLRWTRPRRPSQRRPNPQTTETRHGLVVSVRRWLRLRAYDVRVTAMHPGVRDTEKASGDCPRGRRFHGRSSAGTMWKGELGSSSNVKAAAKREETTGDRFWNLKETAATYRGGPETCVSNNPTKEMETFRNRPNGELSTRPSSIRDRRPADGAPSDDHMIGAGKDRVVERCWMLIAHGINRLRVISDGW
jgi:hypothetical protein